MATFDNRVTALNHLTRGSDLAAPEDRAAYRLVYDTLAERERLAREVAALRARVAALEAAPWRVVATLGGGLNAPQ